MKPTATTNLDARNTNRKYEVFNRRSGEITGNLRKLDGGASLYEAAQGAERALRAAKHEWDVHAARLGEANGKLEHARRQLMTVCRVTAAMSDVFDVAGADAILSADAQDEAALATHLVEVARQVPHAGDGLVAALRASRKQWLSAEAGVKAATADFTRVTRDFSEAYYRAQAVIAQGKALLTAYGVRVVERRPVTRRTPKSAEAPAAAVPEAA
ncbi:MAG: hypothetical protein RL653_1831 [Pseudomonadota bacterium]|jgi:hypothetical protein